MAVTSTKQLIALLAFFTMTVATICSVAIIFEDTQVIEKLEYTEAYKAGAGIGNITTALLLIYLTAFLPNSMIVKGILILLLIAGVVLEMYLNLNATDKDLANADYVVITANFLFRGYLVLYFIQQDWSMLPKIVIPTAESIIPSFPSAPKAPASSIALDENVANKYTTQWRNILNKAREKGNQSIEQKSFKEGWDIVNNAIKANDMTNANLQRALDVLKYADGSEVTGVTVGGKKRK